MARRQDNSFFVAFMTALIVSVGTSLVMHMVVLPRLSPMGFQGGKASAKKVRVPPLIGLQLPQAKNLLKTVGLKMELAGQQKHPSQPAGTVLSHIPIAGSPMSPNEEVKVIISLGPGGKTAATPRTSPAPNAEELVKVPKVTGVSLGKAKRRIRNAGFKVGRITYKDDEDQAPYVILYQRPSARSKAKKGTKIHLSVNKGDD